MYQTLELLRFFKVKYKIIYLLSFLSSIFEISAYGLLGLVIVNFSKLDNENIKLFDIMSIEYYFFTWFLLNSVVEVIPLLN